MPEHFLNAESLGDCSLQPVIPVTDSNHIASVKSICLSEEQFHPNGNAAPPEATPGIQPSRKIRSRRIVYASFSS